MLNLPAYNTDLSVTENIWLIITKTTTTKKKVQPLVSTFPRCFGAVVKRREDASQWKTCSCHMLLPSNAKMTYVFSQDGTFTKENMDILNSDFCKSAFCFYFYFTQCANCIRTGFVEDVLARLHIFLLCSLLLKPEGLGQSPLESRINQTERQLGFISSLAWISGFLPCFLKHLHFQIAHSK